MNPMIPHRNTLQLSPGKPLATARCQPSAIPQQKFPNRLLEGTVLAGHARLGRPAVYAPGREDLARALARESGRLMASS
jgi:hypothetical protein